MEPHENTSLNGWNPSLHQPPMNENAKEIEAKVKNTAPNRRPFDRGVEAERRNTTGATPAISSAMARCVLVPVRQSKLSALPHRRGAEHRLDAVDLTAGLSKPSTVLVVATAVAEAPAREVVASWARRAHPGASH